jgi:dipeptidyl aminopeptidase/acylaminoacyl peptidase
MDITARRTSVASVPLRSLALLLLVGLVIAAALAVVVGSQRRLPAPFGPAENGVLVYAADGGIWTSNADGSDARPIVMDDTESLWPIASRQGTRFTFVRPAEGWDILYVANIDGTGVRALTGPLLGLTSIAWSPDGATIAVPHEVGGLPVIDLVASDGSGIRRIETDIPIDNPAWRPGDQGQLLVRGRVGGVAGLYLLNAADAAVLARLDLQGQGLDVGAYDLLEPDWSPDGRRLAYHTLEALPAETSDNPGYRIHVADVDAAGTVTADARLEFDPLADDEFSARWLPTGDRIAFVRFEGCVDSVLVAAPVPGAAAVTAREVPDVCAYEDRWMGYEIAPDGRSLLTWPLGRSTGEVQAYELEPGGTVPPAFTVFQDVTWQRTAR